MDVRRRILIGDVKNTWKLLDRESKKGGKYWYTLYHVQCTVCKRKRALSYDSLMKRACKHTDKYLRPRLEKRVETVKRFRIKKGEKYDVAAFLAQRLVDLPDGCQGWRSLTGGISKHGNLQISLKGVCHKENARHFIWRQKYAEHDGPLYLTCGKHNCFNVEHMTPANPRSKELKKPSYVVLEYKNEPVLEQGERSMSTKMAYLPIPASNRFVDAYNKMQMLINTKGCDESDAQKAVLFEFKFGDQAQAFMAYAGLMKTYINTVIGSYPKAEAFTAERFKKISEDLQVELQNRGYNPSVDEIVYYMFCHFMDQIDMYGDQAPMFKTIFGSKGYVRNPWAQFTALLMEEVPLLFEIFSQASEYLAEGDTLLVTFPRAMSFVKLILAEKQENINVAMKKAFNADKMELLFK